MTLGPGDLVQDFRRHADEQLVRGETSITFSQQAFNLIESRGFQSLAVSYNPRRARFRKGMIETVNLPKPLAGSSGMRYHLSQLLYAVRLTTMAKRYGTDLAVIDSGTSQYFMLELFRLAGIPVAVNMHNVRWAQGFEPNGRLTRAIRKLDSRFLRRTAIAALGCSPECARQARADGADALPFYLWAGQYDAIGFQPDQPPPADGPFNILFVGRVEQSKGVFDLISMARKLEGRQGRPVRFEVCGDGSALADLRAAVAHAGMEDRIVIRGRLERAALLEAYAQCHAVIVPTRGDFTEGMPLVCAEAMLAARPVITSAVSNALAVIGSSIVEAVPEDVDSYVSAINTLVDDPMLWERLSANTRENRAQFLDRSCSYAAALDRLFAQVSTYTLAPVDYSALYIQTVEQIDTPPPLAIAG